MRKPLFLFAVVLAAGCCSIVRPTGPSTRPASPSVNLSVDPDHLAYTVEIRNETGGPISFWDTISPDSEYTFEQGGPARISITSAAGELLSKNDISKDQWWSFEYMRSQGWALPMRMKTLQPGQKVSARFDLEFLCLGMPAWETAVGRGEMFRDWIRSKKMKLRVQLFWNDPRLGQSVQATWP